MKNETVRAKEVEEKVGLSAARLPWWAKVLIAQHTEPSFSASASHHIHHYSNIVGAILAPKTFSEENQGRLEGTIKIHKLPKEGTNMETLKEVQYQKVVIWSLVVMFSFLQAVPTGWAATRPVPVDEVQSRSVSGSVDALANSPTAPKPVPMSHQAMGFVDSTAFQLNDRPLSRATAEDKPASVIVKNPIEKVIVGPSPVTNPIEKVVIGPKIEKVIVGPSPVTNPIEKVVVGPSPVTNPIEKVIIGPSPKVIPPAVRAHLEELREALGERFLVNAILQTDGTYLVTAKFLETICYENGLCNTLSGRSGLTEMKYGLSSVGIVDKDSLQMTFWLSEKGQAFYPKGDLLFAGMALLNEGMNDTETLAFLAREVTVMNVAANGAVRVRIGQVYFFQVYRDEEGILQVEMYVQLPPAVQAYADQLKNTLGAGYDVTAMLRSDGTYIVRVERVNACSGTKDLGCIQQNAGPLGTFRSLKFILDNNGAVNQDSVRAYYNGVKVAGKLLFDAMGALEASLDPQGSAEMPLPQVYIARLVELASQITVKESGENLLRFNRDGRSYRAFRDENGNVQLDMAMPASIGSAIEKAKVVSSRNVAGKGSLLVSKDLAKAKR